MVYTLDLCATFNKIETNFEIVNELTLYLDEIKYSYLF